MLIGAIVFPFTWEIQCLHEDKKTQSVLVVVFSWYNKVNNIKYVKNTWLRAQNLL